MKEKIRKRLLDTGAVKVGFAEGGFIDPDAHEAYQEWINKGYHGEMSYLERHITLRHTTEKVLPATKTVISLAFDYASGENRSEALPMISNYAYGDDYHIVLKEILKPAVAELQAIYGGKWRICIDSAPVAERFWAMKAGVGRRGLNGAIIVDGCGSQCFLAEILTTVTIDPDSPSLEKCEECGKCLNICPGKALKGDGSADARKCINYLTIEKSGDFTDSEKILVRSGKGFLYGCDLCLKVCPHNNKKKSSTIPDFSLSKEIKTLIPENILAIDESRFNSIFIRSPFLYAGYQKLIRNSKILTDK